MTDEKITALIAEARDATPCNCGHYREPQIECGDHGDSNARLIAALADALEASVQAPENTEPDAFYDTQTGSVIFRTDRAVQAPNERARGFAEGLGEGLALGRAEAVQAPAVDRSALIERVEGSSLDHFIQSFNGDEAGDIDYVWADDGNTGWAMRGGNDVGSVLLKAFDALIASGILRDAADVWDKGNEAGWNDGAHAQVSSEFRITPNPYRRAQQVREGN